MIRPEGSVAASGILCPLSLRVKDAARAETPFLRVFNARYGYLMKYSLPASKAVAAPVAPKVSPLASAQTPRASKPDGMVSAQTKAASPPPFPWQIPLPRFAKVAPNAFLGDAVPRS